MPDISRKNRPLIYAFLAALFALFFLWLDRVVLTQRSFFWDVLLVLLLSYFGWHVSRTVIRLENEAMLDDLTQLKNYKSMQEKLSQELIKAKCKNEPLSMIMMDIDYFKVINDLKGHLHGDRVLRLLAKEISDFFPKSSLSFRWGGEEFVILLPNTDNQKAFQLAENFRSNIESSKKLDDLTISVGVATCQGDVDKDYFFEKVDQCMYQAKSKRNDVCNGGVLGNLS